METAKQDVKSTSQAPERIEIPTSEAANLGAALQRYQMGSEQVRQAQTELENVRLRTLLAARVDRPELYQLDISTVPPTLKRLGEAGQTPGASAPAAPAVTSSQAAFAKTGASPGARRRAKVSAIKEVMNGRRKR